MDGGAWWATVHGVTKSRTWLSDFTITFHFHALEKEMAAHSSVLDLRIPGMGEPGKLPSMGLHRVGHDWSDLAAAEQWTLSTQALQPLYQNNPISIVFIWLIISLGKKKDTMVKTGLKTSIVCNWIRKWQPMPVVLPRESCRRRQWHPTPVLLLGKSHGRRSLVGCSPWGR